MALNDKYAQAFTSYISPEISRRSLPPTSVYFHRYSKGATLYPRQQTLMKILFLEIDDFTDYDRYVIDDWLNQTKNGGDVAIPIDIYERIDWCRKNGYHHFYEVINCSGRRGGKGFIGGKIAEYLVAQMIALGNPQRYYGIDEGKEIHIDVLATQYSQAQSMLYNDIKDAILMDDYITPYILSTSTGIQKVRTPADIDREAKLRAAAGKNALRTSIASIVISPSAASSTSIRGRASFLQCFDEFAHGLDTGSTQSSELIYNAATPSLAQFDKDGMIYVPSSPWSETGKFYQLFKSGMAIDDGVAREPSTFVIKAPSWEWYKDYQYDPHKKRAIILPPEKSPEIRARELQDPETFAVEFRAEFAKTENAYLQAPVVDHLFDPYPEDNPMNVLNSIGNIRKQYYAHADAGRSQDFFAFVIGHRELCDDGYYHVFIDNYKVWQPADFPMDEDGVRRVDYMEVLSWIENIFKHFYVVRFTMDQWNSGLFIDQLRGKAMQGNFLNKAMSISVDNHTASSNFIRWERFKTACYQRWVHIPYYEQDVMGLGHCCLLSEELKLLVVKGNKVDHQEVGPYQHNDCADCCSTVVASLLADQIDAFENGTLSAIVGGAQGGFESWHPGSFISGGMSDAINKSLIDEGDATMRELGYEF